MSDIMEPRTTHIFHMLNSAIIIGRVAKETDDTYTLYRAVRLAQNPKTQTMSLVPFSPVADFRETPDVVVQKTAIESHFPIDNISPMTSKMVEGYKSLFSSVILPESMTAATFKV